MNARGLPHPRRPLVPDEHRRRVRRRGRSRSRLSPGGHRRGRRRAARRSIASVGWRTRLTEPGHRLARQAVGRPLVARSRAKPKVEADRVLVPIEDRPFEAAAAPGDRDLRRVAPKRPADAAVPQRRDGRRDPPGRSRPVRGTSSSCESTERSRRARRQAPRSEPRPEASRRTASRGGRLPSPRPRRRSLSYAASSRMNARIRGTSSGAASRILIRHRCV